MYEHTSEQLLPLKDFFRRLINHGTVTIALILVSLGIGIAGYYFLAHLSGIDSLLNAAMILGGEGPVDRLDNNPAKIFASIYALYSGVVLLVSVGIIVAPIVHRVLHSLHVKEKKGHS